MGAGVKSRKAKPKETGKSSMNLISKLVIVGATVATMALPASAAFASTTHHQPDSQSWQQSDNQYNRYKDPGHNSNWDNQYGNSYNRHNDNQYSGYNNYDPSRNYGHTYDPGYYTNSYGYGGNGYGSGYTNCYCQHPVVPKCDCQTPITFQFPCTYGSWLYETDGPALYNGEVLRYDGQDWTVAQWTPWGNGYQGHGPYFILEKDGYVLQGSGATSEYATTF